MKKIVYYVGLALAAGCLVCYFVPSYHKNSLFALMIDAFGYSNSVDEAIIALVMIIFAVLALIFVAVRKNVPTIIFAALGAGLFLTLNVEDAVKVIFIILSIALIASQVYALILSKKEPKAEAAQTQAPQAQPVSQAQPTQAQTVSQAGTAQPESK